VSGVRIIQVYECIANSVYVCYVVVILNALSISCCIYYSDLKEDAQPSQKVGMYVMLVLDGQCVWVIFGFFFWLGKKEIKLAFCCMKRDDLNISLSSDQLINLQYLHNIFIYTQAYIIIIMLFL